MSGRELVRIAGTVPDAVPQRAARAGARVAALGVATVGTASRLLRLRSTSASDAAHERALVLRDASRRALELHGVAVEQTGPLPLGPALLASNHVSWLDPLVIASLLPCVPISKLDVARWPVIGALARELGVIFVSRGDARSGVRVLNAAGESLARGVSVLNFPEGTTTEGTTVLPFRPGLFGVAVRLRIPVVPVAIRYDPASLAWVGDAPFLPHYLTLAGRRQTRAFVGVGTRILPGPAAGASDLARAAHVAVTGLLQEI